MSVKKKYGEISSDSEDDNDPLIPAAVLLWNDELGEGEIVYDKTFKKWDWLVKADALSDWLSELQEVYSKNLPSEKTKLKARKKKRIKLYRDNVITFRKPHAEIK